MKFPSIQTILQETVATSKRFSLAILFMLVGSFFGVLVNHRPYEIPDSHYYYINIIWSCYLGMLLALAVSLYAERNDYSIKRNILSALVIIVLIFFYYFSLPDHFDPSRNKQFILFIIGLHLFIAFAPFIVKNEVNGFWQYNKSLFLRFLSTALYSCVLFAGMALALLAVENLFKVEIRSKWYLDLWICIFCIFNTVFFLAGVPSGFAKLEMNREYPKGLKIFTQYVLVPMIMVYLLILYAYMFKIIATRQWPYGWVSYLVLAYAIAGIFSLLLFHPIKNELQNKWILIFSRFFYFAICPLIVLLFLAINRRIGEYGITEERYFVLILACWLAFITLYFLFSKFKSIKIIPVTLCAIAFLVSFGPWSAFTISLNSQSQRLKKFLNTNNMLSGEQKIIPAKTNLHAGDAAQIKSIIEYLVFNHGYHSLQPFFSQNLDSMLKEDKRHIGNFDYAKYEKLISYTRVDKFDSSDIVQAASTSRVSTRKDDTLVNLSGYEYLISGFNPDEHSNDSLIKYYVAGNNSIQVEFVRGSGKIIFKNNHDEPLILDLPNLLKGLKMDPSDYMHRIGQDSLVLAGENKTFSVKCFLKDVIMENQHDSIEVSSVNSDILLHFKHP
jgi:Domain of unknown function (DUF4153)